MEKIIEYFSNIEQAVTVVAIIAGTILLATIVKRAFSGYIKRSSRELDNDPTNYKFLQHALVAVIYLSGFSFAFWNIPLLQHIAQSALAGAGILAIAVGFASQQALGNVISGLFIVMFKPYRINDRILVRNDLRGIVEDINLRHTVIRNFENQRIIIPNSIISNEVLVNSNFEDDKICKFMEFGISYGSDLDLAKKIMKDEAEAHPNCIDNRSQEDIENGVSKVTVRLVMFAESSVNLRAWVWAADPPSAFVMGCDLNESIKKRFDAEGIVIPFPQRTISYLDNQS